MPDRFRLIHFKSPESEKRPSGATTSFRTANEGPSLSEALPGDAFSSLAMLNQAKADLGNPDPGVRRLALQYAERLEKTEALSLLQEGTGDPDPEVRAQAVTSLAKYRDPDLAASLKKHLRDVDPGVRIAALKGLFRCGERIDLNLLLQLMSDPSSRVRRKLATLLGWTPVEGVFPVLAEMCRDQEPAVRKAALFSLLTFYPEEGQDRLFEALGDPDSELRHWARKKLHERVDQSGGRAFSTSGQKEAVKKDR